MNKYRITKDGNGRYWVQEKRLFWWSDLDRPNSPFATKEQAQELIARLVAYEEYWHKASIREVVE